jgi:CheY-like chemotaxis protein
MARILIAEDEPHILRVMSLWLKRNGHHVIETPNGLAALKRLEQEDVDLVISDINMPVLDGLGLIEAVRAVGGECKDRNVPFLMLSSRCDQISLAEKVEGRNVCLYPKPFVPSRLVAEIDRLLGAAATHDA